MYRECSWIPALVGFAHEFHSVVTYPFNPLPDSKILALTTLKAFADDKFKVAEITISVLNRVENIVGKGEIAGYQQFLLCPQCIQKAYSLGS